MILKMMTFANNLKYLRRQSELTQETLADILDTSRSRIGGYEENRNAPSIEYLIKIRELFGVSIDELLLENLAEKEVETMKLKTSIYEYKLKNYYK